jgi:hypothetical protein
MEVDQRLPVIKEIVATEQQYVKDLKLVVEVRSFN